MNNMSLALLAISLGGVESLIQQICPMTHSSLPREERIKAGIDDGLVRYSVGIENVEDLINDLDQAMRKDLNMDIFKTKIPCFLPGFFCR